MSITSEARVPVVLAAGLFVLTLITVPAPLDADIRYEIGAQATSPADAAGTFTHRPLMYRLLMAALVQPADRLTDGVLWFERLIRLEALGLAFLAGLLLWLGLRRHVLAAAASLALVVTAALCLIGPSNVLEPEWLALVATVAGVGAALALPGRRTWGVLSGVLGGLLLTDPDRAARVRVRRPWPQQTEMSTCQDIQRCRRMATSRDGVARRPRLNP